MLTNYYMCSEDKDVNDKSQDSVILEGKKTGKETTEIPHSSPQHDENMSIKGNYMYINSLLVFIRAGMDPVFYICSQGTQIHVIAL